MGATIVILWRTGLRIGEALDLAETGSTLKVVVPGELTVRPTVSMGDATTFSNHTYDSLAGKSQTKALSLSATIGSCCDGIFPGMDVNVGPVYDSGSQSLNDTNIGTVVDKSWQLGGFGTVDLAPFELKPDPLPVPTTRTVHPVEGAPFTDQVLASFHDPDPADGGEVAAEHYTAEVRWGDGHTTTGTLAGTGDAFTVSASNTYEEEGAYPVDVTVTDRTVPTVTATAHSRAEVADAPLTMRSAPNLRTVEGAPSPDGLLVATFADADPHGEVADFSATIDWGDGVSSTGRVVAAPGSTFSVLAPPHTYEEEGHPTVTVTIRDQGGASTVAHPDMVTNDAALHAGPAVTNGRLSGSGEPVLLWPNPGNSVVATFTDDDPHGEVADFTAVVDWSDGTSSAGTVSARAGGGFQVSASHNYADAWLGARPLRIDITDAGGARTTATTKLLAYAFTASGDFAVGDRSYAAATSGSALTFWGAQWPKDNALTGGAPASFKGFVDAAPAAPPPPATCPSGRGFTTGPGSSAGPPAVVPAFTVMMVASDVTQAGSRIGGTVAHWVVVQTRPGYGPAAGHTGTGTIIAELC